MKYYQGVDYFLFFLDFPHMGVPGLIVSNSDGTVNIYINTLYNKAVQRRTIKHELRHFAKNHFYVDWLAIEEKELDADDIDDPSCVFADNFSSVEYTEPNTPVIPKELQHSYKVIPMFYSLDSFRDYVFAIQEQVKENPPGSKRSECNDLDVCRSKRGET